MSLRDALRTFVRSFVASFVALVLASCGESSGGGVPTFPVGTPIGEVMIALVGPEGGTVASADGSLTVSVPAGALEAPIELRVQEITRTAPHGEARAFRLEPHGQTFGGPVTVTYGLGSDELGTARALRAATQDERGAWVVLADATVDLEAETLSFETTHFSDWTFVESFALAPEAETVDVGGSVDLVVQNCLYEDVDTGDFVLPALARTCRPFALHSVIEDASVNGAVGGSATVGTVTRRGATITYAAPAAVPDANPVAISAKIAFPGAPDELLVVAEVTVVADDAYHGSATFSDATYIAAADVTWTAAHDYDGVTGYVPSGTVTVTFAGCTVSPSTHAIGPDDGSLEIDWTFDPPRYYGSGLTAWDATLDCGYEAPVPFHVAAQWLTTDVQSANDDGSALEGAWNWWSWSFSR